MVRVVKEPAVRRSEILDVARQLLYTKGYEQMTVQDILDELHLSKGAFYHYFDSKLALLEALLDRMMEEAQQVILPIINDSQLPAIEKFQRFFGSISRWKIERKALLLEILRVWYADENAIVRQKMFARVLERTTSQLAVIIYQGVEEGVMTVSYPDQVGEVLLGLMLNLGDTFGRQLFLDDPVHVDMLAIERLVEAYCEAIERILGAPAGLLHLTDMETLRQWFE